MQGVSQGMRVEGCSQICTGLLMTLKFLGALPYVSGTLKDKRGNPTKAAERNVFFNRLKSDTFLPRNFHHQAQESNAFLCIVQAKPA